MNLAKHYKKFKGSGTKLIKAIFNMKNLPLKKTLVSRQKCRNKKNQKPGISLKDEGVVSFDSNILLKSF